jgi:hypothetical protein
VDQQDYNSNINSGVNKITHNQQYNYELNNNNHDKFSGDLKRNLSPRHNVDLLQFEEDLSL